MNWEPEWYPKKILLKKKLPQADGSKGWGEVKRIGSTNTPLVATNAHPPELTQFGNG